MENTFELKKGKLVFEEDKIVITDDVKYQKRVRLFSSIFLIGMGVYNLTIFVRTSDTHTLTSGLIVGIAGIIFLLMALMANVQNEIYLKDITSMKIKRIFFKEFLVIKLNNHKTRQVAGIYNAERLEEYIKTFSLPK